MHQSLAQGLTGGCEVNQRSFRLARFGSASVIMHGTNGTIQRLGQHDHPWAPTIRAIIHATVKV
jgi:hypothetical protein